ncbi:MAG: hypothetical protein K9W44_06040 [Candidatus Lokiarchaeota archaeon]|nr:hypothetical protein [Candidatus Harpocratesius repetitus]
MVAIIIAVITENPMKKIPKIIIIFGSVFLAVELIYGIEPLMLITFGLGLALNSS